MSHLPPESIVCIVSVVCIVQYSVSTVPATRGYAKDKTEIDVHQMALGVEHDVTVVPGMRRGEEEEEGGGRGGGGGGRGGGRRKEEDEDEDEEGGGGRRRGRRGRSGRSGRW
jgi:hypothetical protein